MKLDSHSGRKSGAVRFAANSERHQHSQSHEFEDAVYREKGVVCSVKIKEEQIQVRAKSYAEYLMARSVISKRSGLQIVWKEEA